MTQPQAPSPLLQYLKTQYRRAAVSREQLPVPPLPVAADEAQEPPTLEELEEFGLAQHALEFLRSGPDAGDRSGALFACGVALVKVLSPQAALAVLASNEHAWSIALEHRKGDVPKAMNYLWKEHVVKASARIRASELSLDDFENLEMEAEQQVQAPFAKALSNLGRLDPASGELVIAGRWRPTKGSDQALAKALADAARNQFRWTPGMGWMVNLGGHWVRDDLLQIERLSAAVCMREAKDLRPNQRRAACSAGTVRAVVQLARSATGIVTPAERWDAHPMLLNTPTGVYDLQTGKVVPRDGLLFTQVTGVAPQPLPAPAWSKFIREVFSGDLEMINFIQRLCGYCLTGDVREQKLFFLYGVGANGKSVFLDVLRHVAGVFAHNLPPEILMRQSMESHPTGLASLRGRRIAISSEIDESAQWSESRIKSLTGDATISARFMRQDFFTFDITHKHLIAGNFKPRLQGDDSAMARRMILVPFNERFEGARRDKDLLKKLQAEGPGILAWMIEGAKLWSESGLQVPARVLQASHDYLAENDDLSLWFEECCVIDRQSTVRASACYVSFSRFTQQSGERPPTQKAFGQRLARRFNKGRDREGVFYTGFRLRGVEDDLESLAVDSP